MGAPYVTVSPSGSDTPVERVTARGSPWRTVKAWFGATGARLARVTGMVTVAVLLTFRPSFARKVNVALPVKDELGVKAHEPAAEQVTEPWARGRVRHHRVRQRVTVAVGRVSGQVDRRRGARCRSRPP